MRTVWWTCLCSLVQSQLDMEEAVGDVLAQVTHQEEQLKKQRAALNELAAASREHLRTSQYGYRHGGGPSFTLGDNARMPLNAHNESQPTEFDSVVRLVVVRLHQLQGLRKCLETCFKLSVALSMIVPVRPLRASFFERSREGHFRVVCSGRVSLRFLRWRATYRCRESVSAGLPGSEGRFVTALLWLSRIRRLSASKWSLHSCRWELD